jgi:hypothetical protein
LYRHKNRKTKNKTPLTPDRLNLAAKFVRILAAIYTPLKPGTLRLAAKYLANVGAIFTKD